MSINILFLCPHASAKSVAAKALFNDAAAASGLEVVTSNAGTEPDTALHPDVEQRLTTSQLSSAVLPTIVTAQALSDADIVVNMGCNVSDLPLDHADLGKVVEWSMPDFSADPDAAFAAIQAATHRLAATIARRSRPIVVVGIGQMGGVFTKAFLGAGYTVVPVTRSTSMAEAAALTPDPSLVLVTVGEDDLGPVLASMPAGWKDRVGLIQNELLPRDWERHGITDPTVAVVWFEKKRGIDTKVIISTPVAGPAAPTVVAALTNDQIASHEVTAEAIVDELVTKNLYILVANIAGLETGGTVSDLWNNHRNLATAVGDEVLAIQEYLVGRPIDSKATYAGMVHAFDGDPDHGTTGRSAPRRLERAINHAAQASVDTPNLTAIARAHDVSA
jgi:protein-tyrosine-phosphatase